MAWQTAQSGRKRSLSAWLRAQGFAEEAASAVQRSKLDSGDVARLKQLQASARGSGDMLSRVQLRDVKPETVQIVGGKLANSSRAALSPGKLTGGKVASVSVCNSEVAGLRKQIEELTARLESAVSPPKVATPAAPWKDAKGVSPPKACHACGATDHLRAACPLVLDLQRCEAWLEILQGETCLLPKDTLDEQVREAIAKQDALKAKLAAAKEKTVLPEHVLSERRAEAKKRAAALANARAKLEANELRVRQLQAEGADLQKEVDAQTAAFREAELALEEAQQKVVASIDPPRIAPRLSAQGTNAVAALTAHLANLASPENISRAEEEHRSTVAAAEANGSTAPSLLEFVLQRLSCEGSKQLDIVQFDLAAAPVPTAAAVEAASPPAVSPSGVMQDEGGRLPARLPPKALPTGAAKAQAMAFAEIQRQEVREKFHAACVAERWGDAVGNEC